MDKDIEDTIAFFRLGKEGEEMRRVFLQGDLFQFIRRGEKRYVPRSKHGRIVSGFSAEARGRMFKFSATIDFARCTRNFFCTFTYPDNCLPRKKALRTRDRSQLFRAIECHCGKWLGGIWRQEWVPRQTGSHVGEWEPHLHVLLFNIGWIPYKKIRLSWNNIIGFDGEASMKFRRCKEGQRAAHYVAKYCAKADPLANLDNVVHLNIEGRHYGYPRKELIPRCQRIWYGEMPDMFWHFFWQEIKHRYSWINDEKQFSISFLGKNRHAMHLIFHSVALTLGITPCKIGARGDGA